MPKLKTNKTFSKRYRITRRGKVMKRAAGQAHFNARATGEKTMGKRRDQKVHATRAKTIKRYINQ